MSDTVDLPYHYICSECANERGAKWPDCHAATYHTNVCEYCNKEKGVCNIGDWDWPDGKRVGMRD